MPYSFGFHYPLIHLSVFPLVFSWSDSCFLSVPMCFFFFPDQYVNSWTSSGPRVQVIFSLSPLSWAPIQNMPFQYAFFNTRHLDHFIKLTMMLKATNLAIFYVRSVYVLPYSFFLFEKSNIKNSYYWSMSHSLCITCAYFRDGPGSPICTAFSDCLNCHFNIMPGSGINS